MKGISLLVSALLCGVVLAAEQSPYAGEEVRSIKSLSAEEIDALESGAGMGFAKLAEMQLNAVALGEKVLGAEMDLDRQFERGTVSPESLASANTPAAAALSPSFCYFP